MELKTCVLVQTPCRPPFPDMQALAAALPDLQQLKLCDQSSSRSSSEGSGSRSIPGSMLMAVVGCMLQLRKLTLSTACEPLTDLTAAAAVAQCQVFAGARPGPLQIQLAWKGADVKAAEEEVQRLLGAGQLGPRAVHVLPEDG